MATSKHGWPRYSSASASSQSTFGPATSAYARAISLLHVPSVQVMTQSYSASALSSMPSACWIFVGAPMMAPPHRAIEPPGSAAFSRMITDAPLAAASMAQEAPAAP